MLFFFFNDTATTEIYTLSLHDALPIFAFWNLTGRPLGVRAGGQGRTLPPGRSVTRSEEHTSELQSLTNLVCRLLLEKKKKQDTQLGKRTRKGCRRPDMKSTTTTSYQTP